jgi:hypothetical protein
MNCTLFANELSDPSILLLNGTRPVLLVPQVVQEDEIVVVAHGERIFDVRDKSLRVSQSL